MRVTQQNRDRNDDAFWLCLSSTGLAAVFLRVRGHARRRSQRNAFIMMRANHRLELVGQHAPGLVSQCLAAATPALGRKTCPAPEPDVASSLNRSYRLPWVPLSPYTSATPIDPRRSTLEANPMHLLKTRPRGDFDLVDCEDGNLPVHAILD